MAGAELLHWDGAAWSLVDFADLESTATRMAVNGAVGVDVMSVGISETVMRELARDTVILGAPSAEWWSRQETDLTRRFADTMRKGVIAGETTDQLIRRVRGTKAAEFTDGIMQASRRNAAALVRTSLSAVSAAAREATYQANDDVIRGTQHISVLDGRTTVICLAYSGASWDLEGNPLPDSPVVQPYLPLLVIDPKDVLPENAIPFSQVNGKWDRLIARLRTWSRTWLTLK